VGDGSMPGANLPGMGGIYNSRNLQTYHYAGNNPIKYTDPTGEVVITATTMVAILMWGAILGGLGTATVASVSNNIGRTDHSPADIVNIYLRGASLGAASLRDLVKNGDPEAMLGYINELRLASVDIGITANTKAISDRVTELKRRGMSDEEIANDSNIIKYQEEIANRLIEIKAAHAERVARARGEEIEE
jgi:hypothetical protein